MPEAHNRNGHRSTRRRFRLTELVCFDLGADAHLIGTAHRNFFDACHPSSPSDKFMCGFFPGRHYRKSDFHSYTQLRRTDPEVKAMSRNIARPSQDWLELPEVGLGEPNFDLKVQVVATSCPTFFQFTWLNAFSNSYQPLTMRLQPAVVASLYGPIKNVRDPGRIDATPFAPLAVYADSAYFCGLRNCLRQ
jgi:hypothetical protein